MIGLITRLARRVLRALRGRQTSGKGYWERRAKDYGRRSVLNIAHTDSEFESVTEFQKQEIFPYVRGLLGGNEQFILDFGCGVGRFTADLASMTGGHVIGVDPIEHLLEMAPKHGRTTFKVMREGQIPVPDNRADVVWVCLVLGGLQAKVLAKTVLEIQRVLKVGGLLFLVENTTNRVSSGHWIYRTALEYQKMFAGCSLAHLHDYYDMGECISILAGRKVR